MEISAILRGFLKFTDRVVDCLNLGLKSSLGDVSATLVVVCTSPDLKLLATASSTCFSEMLRRASDNWIVIFI